MKLNSKTGFTLVELLVVIAIIGILIGMLLPAVQQVREAARRTACMNNMHQVSLACLNYESANERFPAGGRELYNDYSNSGAGVGRDYLSYLVYILPYMEESNLHQKFDLSYGSTVYPNKVNLAVHRLDGVLCPSSQAPFAYRQNSVPDEYLTPGQVKYTTHYYCISGPIGENPETGTAYEYRTAAVHGHISTEGVFWYEGDFAFPGKLSRGFGLIKDGSSNTILIGEMSYDLIDPSDMSSYGAPYRPWTRGGSYSFSSCMKNIKYPINTYDFDHATTKHNNINMGSNHPGGCIFALADGSTHFASENIDMSLYLAWASANGNEVHAGPR